jgi:hypothetical protein
MIAMSLSELVTRAYKEKNISGKCELCGHSDWGVSEELRFLTFSTATEDGQLESMTNVPVAVITCNHCGNMRIHARRIFEAQ